MELNSYLALLTEHHTDLAALGEAPPGAGTGAMGGPPIKPEEIGFGSTERPIRAAPVHGGSGAGVQTVKTGSRSTKTASFGETVFAGSPGETMFKSIIEEVTCRLVALIQETGEDFSGLPRLGDEPYRISYVARYPVI